MTRTVKSGIAPANLGMTDRESFDVRFASCLDSQRTGLSIKPARMVRMIEDLACDWRRLGG
jgi:hypothetical protein